MKPISLVTIVLLTAVAVAHLLRLVFAVEVSIGGGAVPMWPSVLATVVPAALAFGLWREQRA